MSLNFTQDTSTQLTYSSFGFATQQLDNYATSNYVLSLSLNNSNYTTQTSNVLRGLINTKQDTLTAATNLLGIGSAITALDYAKITLNKPTYFPADWNTTISNKPIIYTQTETSNLLNNKQNTLTASTILSGIGSNITLINYSNLFNLPSTFPPNMSNIYSRSESDNRYLQLAAPTLTSNLNVNANITTQQLYINNPTSTASIIFSANPSIYSIFSRRVPWAMYFAEDYNASSPTVLPNYINNDRDATLGGTAVTKTTLAGNGAIGDITYISGTTASTISFPAGSIPSTFTILSLTRYTGPNNRQRILQSSFGNWLHGHWDGRRGVAYYEGWKAGSSIGTQDDWLCFIGKNAGPTPGNILADGATRGGAPDGTGGGSYRLGINLGTYGSSEASAWALSCVMIWDTALTDAEMVDLNTIVNTYRNDGVSIKTIINSTIDDDSIIESRVYDGIEKTELLLFKGNDGTGVKGADRIRLKAGNIAFDTYSSLTPSGNRNNENIVMLINENGNVGIGTNTNLTYKLNVNGSINSTSLWQNGTQIDFNSYLLKSGGTMTGEINGVTRIGIGTNAPNYRLHIRGPNNAILRIETDTNSPGQVSGIEFGIPAFTSAGSARITSTARDGNVADLQFNTSSTTNNSTVKMTITGSGNVGIANTDPSNIFQIGSGERLRISNGNNDFTRIGTSDTGGFDNTAITISGSSRSSVAGFIDYEAINRHRFWTTSTGTWNERLTIMNTGNVGIANNNPTNIFQIGNGERLKISNGSNDFTRIGTCDTCGVNNTCITISGSSRSPVAGFIDYEAVNRHRFFTTSTGTWIERLTIMNTGNVGIGMTNPDNILQIVDGGRLRISNGNNDFTILGTKDNFNDTTNTRIVLSGSARSTQAGNIEYVGVNNHIFYTTSSGAYDERMRILSTGRIGISTSSPLTRFTIRSSYSDENTGFSIDATDGAVYNLRIFPYVIDAARVGYIFKVNNQTSSTNALLLGDNGSVGVGSLDTAYKLNVNGSINSTSLWQNGTQIDFSSYLLKSGGTITNNLGIGTSPLYQTHIHINTYNNKPLLTLSAGIAVSPYGGTARNIGQPLLGIGENNFTGLGDYFGIGFGYKYEPNDKYCCEIGCVITDINGAEKGDLLFSTRNTTGQSDVAVERMRLTTAGNITIGSNLNSTTYKLNVDGSLNATTLWQNGTQLNTLLDAKQNTLTFTSPLVNTTNTITLNESAITTLTNFYNKNTSDGRFLKLDGTNIMTGNLEISKTTPTITLRGTGGGGATARLNLATYDFATNEPPCSIITTDDGNYSSSFDIRLKTPGAIANSQTTALFIKSDRNVGIGTNNPQTKIEIFDPTNPKIFLNQNGTTRGFLSIQSGGLDLGNDVGTGKYIRFMPDNVERMRIKSNGNVGIGTNDPKCAFQVNGVANISNGGASHTIDNNYMQTGSLTIGSQTLNYGGGTNWNANTAGLMLECEANTEIAVHDAGQRIASLMYYSGNTITIGRDMAWGVIGLVDIKSKLTILGELTNQHWRFTNESDYLRLYTASGNNYFRFAARTLWCAEDLQVGTTATFNSYLNINNASSINFNKTANSGWIIEFGTSPNGAVDSMIFFHRESSPSSKSSRWWFNGAQASTSSEISDERIKKEINDIQTPLNKIMELKPKEYYLCDDKDYNKKFGVIAQDVEKVFPEFIHTEKDYVANIYSYATYDNYIITLDKDITDLINIDDELKIILDNNDKNNLEIVIDDTPYNNRYKKRFVKVVEIIDNHSFKIDIELQENDIFIYGKKVDDFKRLDYESLYCLNIAATQELYKIIQNLQERISILESR